MPQPDTSDSLPAGPASATNAIASRIERRFREGPFARATRYGLRRDLDVPFAPPEAKISLTMRPLEQSDLVTLFPAESTGRDAAEFGEATARLALAEKAPGRGLVAVDQTTGSPCYVQWLLGPQDNDIVRRIGGFPELGPDEALLEGAYTPPAHRGLKIMPAAMAVFAERARDLGACYVITFVDVGNVPSLKGCQRAGFHPDLLHRYLQVGFGTIRRNRFEKLPEDDPRRSAAF